MATVTYGSHMPAHRDPSLANSRRSVRLPTGALDQPVDQSNAPHVYIRLVKCTVFLLSVCVASFLFKFSLAL
jgi:hypothetical protein